MLGHLVVGEKSSEIPAAPELIEALWFKGLRVHSRRRTRAKKLIASGNQLFVQVKVDQPRLRRRRIIPMTTSKIIPELIGVELDMPNPVQPASMDPAKLKRQYGDKLCFWGCIDWLYAAA